MKRLFVLFLFALPLSAMNAKQEEMIKMKETSVVAPRGLGKIEVHHHPKEGFHVVQDSVTHKVHAYWVDAMIRNMKPAELKKFQQEGYIKVGQKGNNDFTLEAALRVKGGLWISGMIGGWLVRTVAYGTVLAGATSAIKKIAGSDKKNKSIGDSVNLGMAVEVAGQIKKGMPQGVGFVSEVIQQTGNSEKAQLATVAFIAGSGYNAGLSIGYVEAFAFWVQGALTAIPWLP